MTDRGFVLVPIYGHIDVQTRMRPEGNRIIGEGRSVHYDVNGLLVKETPWTTNCVLSWDQTPCRRWWEFWK